VAGARNAHALQRPNKEITIILGAITLLDHNKTSLRENKISIVIYHDPISSEYESQIKLDFFYYYLFVQRLLHMIFSSIT